MTVIDTTFPERFSASPRLAEPLPVTSCDEWCFALVVWCPSCGAQPDNWCVSGLGNLHTSRVFAAVAGGAA